jgi:hypothetical protein
MNHVKKVIERRLRSSLLAFALLGAISPLAAAQDSPQPTEWRQTVMFYGMGASISGDAQVGPLQVPVDVGMSDFFDSLKFGAMVAYGVANDDWSIAGDVTYMNLGQSNSTQQNRASAGLDVEQITAMATVGRRILPHVEALVSLAYFDVSADLRLRLLQQVRTASRDADWLDGLVGLRYQVPVSGKWSFTLRGDIGGGGSDLTWHALTRVTHQTSERFGWYVGYRAIAYDYEDGTGLNYQHYDLVQHGPGAGVAFSF